MVSNQLVLAGIVAFATVTQTSAFVDVSNLFSGVDDGLGGIMDSVMEMNNEMFENFQLGVGDEDLQKLITGIFSDMAGWFDAMFDDFDIDAIKGVVDEAIAEASDGIQGFGNVFESVFEDVTEIPEQYAFFLKDKAIDVAEIAKEVFSADAIQGIPDDVAAMFENAGDDIEDAFGMMLEVPSMVVALGKAGVDVNVLAATAEIGALFAKSAEDTFFAGVDFSKADVADIQKAVAAMDDESQAAFGTAMKGTRDGTDVALGAAWTTVLENEELAKELNANGVDVTVLSSAASASTAAEMIGDSGAAATTATAVAAVATAAALLM